MTRFLIGFAIAGAGLFAWNLPLLANAPLPDGQVFHLATLNIVAPLTTAWLTLGIGRYFRRSRLFDTRSPPRAEQLLCGLAAGALSMLLAACGIVLLDRQLGDMAIMALSSILGTGIVIRLSRVIRPGHCANCDYDLRSSIGFGRCPECGLAI